MFFSLGYYPVESGVTWPTKNNVYTVHRYWNRSAPRITVSICAIRVCSKDDTAYVSQGRCAYDAYVSLRSLGVHLLAIKSICAYVQTQTPNTFTCVHWRRANVFVVGLLITRGCRVRAHTFMTSNLMCLTNAPHTPSSVLCVRVCRVFMCFMTCKRCWINP